jgi:hypothetical protein
MTRLKFAPIDSSLFYKIVIINYIKVACNNTLII